jgi:hypothetical protein
VGLAFKTWALHNNDHFPMQVCVTNGGTMELVSASSVWPLGGTARLVNAGNVWPHFLVMSNELSTSSILFCPQESEKKRTKANTFLPYAPPPGAPYHDGAPWPTNADGLGSSLERPGATAYGNDPIPIPSGRPERYYRVRTP